MKDDAEAGLEKTDPRNSLEPSSEPLKWPTGATNYPYRASYAGNPMMSEVTALLMKAGPTPLDLFWDPSFKILYDTYYQELASEALGSRWEWIDKATSLLVGITGGSAVAGWAIWGTTSGKLIWAGLGGAASLASIVHSRLAVPSKVKEQDELRRLFRHLRLGIEGLRQNLEIGLITPTAAKADFDKLQTEYRVCMEKTKKELAFTKGLQKRVEGQLRGILKEVGLSNE